jgi:hypothetical protein
MVRCARRVYTRSLPHQCRLRKRVSKVVVELKVTRAEEFFPKPDFVDQAVSSLRESIQVGGVAPYLNSSTPVPQTPFPNPPSLCPEKGSPVAGSEVSRPSPPTQTGADSEGPQF